MPFPIAQKNEKLICKSNKTCTGYACWKLYNTEKGRKEGKKERMKGEERGNRKMKKNLNKWRDLLHL